LVSQSGCTENIEDETGSVYPVLARENALNAAVDALEPAVASLRGAADDRGREDGAGRFVLAGGADATGAVVLDDVEVLGPAAVVDGTTVVDGVVVDGTVVVVDGTTVGGTTVVEGTVVVVDTAVVVVDRAVVVVDRIAVVVDGVAAIDVIGVDGSVVVGSVVAG
jgi:NDP-sugar pyrophosphorylase family protein